MDIKMDQIDEFALKGAIERLELLLRDAELLACEREQHGIRAIVDSAVTAVKTVKYALKISGANC